MENETEDIPCCILYGMLNYPRLAPSVQHFVYTFGRLLQFEKKMLFHYVFLSSCQWMIKNKSGYRMF